MKVSIAMAAYNGARHIGEQLQSFAAQTRRPDQLVVTDDGSTDDTIALIEAFAGSVPFEVVVHRNERNLGYARNFMGAMSRCDGDIIFLSDQDDVWLPHKIATVAAAHAQAGEPLLTINDQEIADADMTRSGRTTLEQLRRHGRKADHFIHGCCTAFGAPFAPLLGDLPAGMAHDDWLHFMASRLGRRQVIPEVLQLYRRHEAATTSSVYNSSQGPDLRAAVALATPKGTRQGREAGLQRRLDLLHLVRTRLVQSTPTGWTPETVALALERLEREIAAVEGRRGRLTGERGRSAAVEMLVAGQYRYFDGWRSFLRDLLL